MHTYIHHDITYLKAPTYFLSVWYITDPNQKAITNPKGKSIGLSRYPEPDAKLKLRLCFFGTPCGLTRRAVSHLRADSSCVAGQMSRLLRTKRLNSKAQGTPKFSE